MITENELPIEKNPDPGVTTCDDPDPDKDPELWNLLMNEKLKIQDHSCDRNDKCRMSGGSCYYKTAAFGNGRLISLQPPHPAMSLVKHQNIVRDEFKLGTLDPAYWDTDLKRMVHRRKHTCPRRQPYQSAEQFGRVTRFVSSSIHSRLRELILPILLGGT